MQNRPLVSIITPCLNSETYITEAIESVLCQGYANVEHIIIDGGSTDGTLELLRRYSHLRVISEPDNGIYNALNKGIRIAKGKIVGCLNSDDFYEKNIFNTIIQRFENNPSLRTIRGGAVVFEDQGNGVRRKVAQYTALSDAETYFSRTVLGVAVINAYFFHKDVYDQIGLFDTCYRIAADRDFILKVALSGICCSNMERIFYYYRQHEGSLTINRKTVPWLKIRDEHLEMAEHYMKGKGGTYETQRVFKLMHSREASEGALQALKEMKFRKVSQYVIRGHRYDALWLRVFIVNLSHKFVSVITGSINE